MLSAAQPPGHARSPRGPRVGHPTNQVPVCRPAGQPPASVGGSIGQPKARRLVVGTEAIWPPVRKCPQAPADPGQTAGDCRGPAVRRPPICHRLGVWLPTQVRCGPSQQNSWTKAREEKAEGKQHPGTTEPEQVQKRMKSAAEAPHKHRTSPLSATVTWVDYRGCRPPERLCAAGRPEARGRVSCGAGCPTAGPAAESIDHGFLMPSPVGANPRQRGLCSWGPRRAYPPRLAPDRGPRPSAFHPPSGGRERASTLRAVGRSAASVLSPRDRCGTATHGAAEAASKPR